MTHSPHPRYSPDHPVFGTKIPTDAPTAPPPPAVVDRQSDDSGPAASSPFRPPPPAVTFDDEPGGLSGIEWIWLAWFVIGTAVILGWVAR